MTLAEFTTEELSKELAKRCRSQQVVAAINRAADAYQVEPADIISHKRTARISAARDAAIYIARTTTQFNLTELGLAFGERDHTTISKSLARAKLARDTDRRFREVTGM